MKSLLNECVEKTRRSRRNYRRYLSVFLVLALVTTLGVNWGLHRNGISATAAYTCGQAEHQHTEECFSKVLTCGYEEGQAIAGHTHTDECYQQQEDLTCDQTEHSHFDSCYDEDGNLICTLPEHTHSASCYTAESVLVCGKEEGEGAGTHAHTDACYTEELTCGLEEHTHTVSCIIDTTADTETASVWKATLPSSLSGVWADDLISVARSQLGYTESTVNMIVVNEDTQATRGYTRYGAWYGDPYGDWCAMFVSFCLNYADIPTSAVPEKAECSSWITALTNLGLYKSAASYTPVAGDIIFFDVNGDGTSDHVGIVESITGSTITTIEGNSSDKVKENTYSINNPTIVGYGVLPENPDNTSNAKTSSLDFGENEEDDSAIMPASDDANSTGIDLNEYITSANFQKKNGNMWVDSMEFTTSDQARGTLNFENIYTSTLQANSNTVYVDLPAGIDCSRFTGEYDTYDGGTHSGKYHYELNSDGSYRIVLVLDDDYVSNAGDVIGGSLQFQFYWDADKIPEDGKVPVKIGDYDGEIKVEKSENDKGDTSSANYKIDKTAGGVSYSDDGKTAYIDYTITLTVKKTMSSPITMKDILSGVGFEYDSQYGVKATNASGTSINANYKTTTSTDSGASTNIELWTGESGTYTLNYRVKTTSNIDASNPDYSKLTSQVYNKIVVPEDGDSQTSAETWTSTTTGTVNKQGQLVTGTKGTYIDYTVYLNAGAIIKNLKTPANFTDTLPDTLELQGNVTVKQYDVKGNVVSTTTATVDGQNISYTTPTGQYYYIITYRTMVKDSDKLPIGSTVIKNDGKSTGGIDGSSSSGVEVKNHVLKKAFSDQKISQDDNGTWINTMNWTSTINVKSSLKGYVYEDYSGLYWDQSSNTAPTMTMSDAQRAAIVVTDANGNKVDSNNYTVTTSNHATGYTSDGLFKLTFTADVTGPVTISYQTTADLTRFTDGVDVSFRNFAILEKDGHYDYDQADSTKIIFRRQSKDYVHKYGSTYTVDSTGKVQLEPGQNTLTWTIQANESRTLHSDLLITDVIADGLTYVEGSLKVTEGISYGKSVETSYDEATKTLTIKIPADAYSGTGFSNAVIITYDTKLPDSFFEKGDTTISVKNTAKIDFNGQTSQSTFTQEVTRQVVGKSGSYDKVNKILSYNIVINPDGSTLNSGKSLKVEDTLSGQYDADKEVVKNVSLASLDVYTAVKSTDSSGKVTVKPGAYVKTMTEVDSHPDDFQYVYDDDTKTFTTYLPDRTAYVIVAKYSVDVDVADTVNLKNAVTLTGENSWSKEDSSTKITQDTTGETHTNKHTLVVAKHDLASYETMPSGAEFKLEQYKDNSWSDFSSTDTTSATQATGANGKASWYGIDFGVLYKLTETKAPDGYVIDNTPTYFVVVRESQKNSLSLTLPSGVDKDSVKIYTVKDDTASKQYYANIEIDRYDAKDTSKVDPSQISVTKEWVDSSGKKVTGAAALATMPDITVTLTKHVPKSANTVTVTGDGSSSTISVNNGGYIVFKGVRAFRFGDSAQESQKYTFSCTDSSVSYTRSEYQSDDTYTVTVGPINGNCTITSSALYWDSCYTNMVTTEGGTAPEGTVDTVIGTATLNAENNWYYLWENLDITTTGVTYSITETSVNGYTATYTVNGNKLQPGATFTPGITGDKVVITNTANPVYSLPSTGGPGTLLYTTLGLALITLALLYGISLRRRRERGARS